MRFYKLGSDKQVFVNIRPYLIDWNKKSASNFQTNVKKFLQKFWSGHIVCEEMRIPGSLLRCDLVNLTKKICIESSGGQHFAYNPFFHGQSRMGNYLKSIKYDMAKLHWMEKNGFKCAEILEEDVPNLSVNFFKERFDIDII